MPSAALSSLCAVFKSALLIKKRSKEEEIRNKIKNEKKNRAKSLESVPY